MKCIFQKIQIHNFKSFADQEFDFSSRPGISTIVGVNNDIPGAANAAGKSSLFSALFYVLFGKDGVKTKNKFLKNRYVDSNEFSVQLYLNIDGKSFKICRGSIGNASYLRLFEVNKNQEIEISKASIIETECFLKHLLSNLSSDIFLKTVLLSPVLGQNFFTLSSKERAEFLNFLSGTNKIYSINELVNKDINNLSTSIKISENELMSLSKQIDILKKKKEDFLENQEKIQKEHNAQIQRHNNIIKDNTIELNKHQEKYSKLKEQNDILNNDYENTEQNIQNIKMKIVAGATHVKSLISKNKQLNAQIEQNKELLDKLCDICKDKIDEYLNVQNLKDSIKENDNNINSEKESLVILQSEFNELTNKIIKIKENKESVAPELNSEYARVIKLNKSIESEKELIETIENNFKNSNEIEPFSELITTNENEIELKRNEKDSLCKERQKLSIIKFITNDDIVHRFIINQFANDINLYLSRYLSVMGVNYQIEFDNNLTYTFMTPAGEVSYETFSSGEKMRLNIAISFAFRKLLFKYLNIDINMLVLDEYVDSALDKLAISGIINLLNELKIENPANNIYVISHRSEVLSEFGGSRLIVKKTNGISEIVVEDE